jgi:hypothetical protein
MLALAGSISLMSALREFFSTIPTSIAWMSFGASAWSHSTEIACSTRRSM